MGQNESTSASNKQSSTRHNSKFTIRQNAESEIITATCDCHEPIAVPINKPATSKQNESNMPLGTLPPPFGTHRVLPIRAEPPERSISFHQVPRFVDSEVSHPKQDNKISETIQPIKTSMHNAISNSEKQNILPPPRQSKELQAHKSVSSDLLYSVERDYKTPPKDSKIVHKSNNNLRNECGNPFLSAKFSADLTDFEKKIHKREPSGVSTALKKKQGENGEKSGHKLEEGFIIKNAMSTSNPKYLILSSKIREKLEDIYKTGDLKPDDLDQRALETLGKLAIDDALYILGLFLDSDPKKMKNKSAYLCSMIKSRINTRDDITDPSDVMHSKDNAFSPQRGNLPSFFSTNKPLFVDSMSVEPKRVQINLVDKTISKKMTNDFNVVEKEKNVPTLTEESHFSSSIFKGKSTSPMVMDIIEKTGNNTNSLPIEPKRVHMNLVDEKISKQMTNDCEIFEKEKNLQTLTEESHFSPSFFSKGKSTSPVAKESLETSGYNINSSEFKLITEKGNLLIDFNVENIKCDRSLEGSDMKGMGQKNEVHLEAQGKHKKNIPRFAGMKNHGLKPNALKTLKKVEDLAESLTNSTTLCSKTTSPKKAFSNSRLLFGNSENVHTVEPQGNYSLEDCIFHMTNLDACNKEKESLLQRELLHNLQLVNSFLNVLRTHPIFDVEMLKEVNILKDNVSSLIPENLCPDYNLGRTATNLSKFDSSMVDETPNSGQEEPHSSGAINVIELLEEETNINIKTGLKTTTATAYSDGNSNNETISMSSFKALIDSLPHELKPQKANVSLQKNKLHCNVCNKPIVFTIQNLEEHLNGKFHTNALKDKNYKDMLNLVFESCKQNLKLDVPYICLQCGSFQRNKEEAMNHITGETHKKNDVDIDSKWYFCDVCCINIYCTDRNFNEHCLTMQHVGIMKLKQVNKEPPTARMPPISGSITDDGDRVSVCSSTSSRSQRRLKPHEILISIAKDKQTRTNCSSVGLYCQLCNKYAVYDSSPSHLNTEVHKNQCLNVVSRDAKKYNIYSCPTCKVDVFGDISIWNEHMNLQLHKGLSEVNNIEDKCANEGSEPGSDELSESNNLLNDEGPHFDLMKNVLRKHLTNEPTAKVFFGFYCHLCEAFSQDEQQWTFHQSTASHINRLNSFECVGKEMMHDCITCNIRLICDKQLLEMHKKSVAHQAIARHQTKKGAESATKSEVSESTSDESSDDESESSEDGNIGVEENETKSVQSGNTEKNNNKVFRKGVYITGLTPNVGEKDIFEALKSFGFIKKLSLDKKYCTATVFFQKVLPATNVLQAKSLRIKNTLVRVHPAMGQKNPRSKKKREKVVLNGEVKDVLVSWPSLQSYADRLLNEVQRAGNLKHEKANRIQQNILALIPHCKVHMFGSQVTGLATLNSDFDIYIDYDNLSYFKDLLPKQQEDIIRSMLSKLTLPKSGFRVTEYILEARVPIIRAIHNATNTCCDISCRSGLSVENSHLVKAYVSTDPRVRWLIVFIKWWMRVNGLLDRSIFTSYATTWLVLFFLMRLSDPIICPVTHLQKGCNPYSIGYWDCRFRRDINMVFRGVNKLKPFELLAEFFKLYGTFRFMSTVLCPLTGALIPRKKFDDLVLFPAYAPYVKRIQMVPNAERLRTSTPICLQDPFDLAHNVTKGVRAKDLKKFQTLCLESAKICESNLISK